MPSRARTQEVSVECHKCPEFGRHAGVPYEATPCASCSLSDGHTRGAKVYNDAVPSAPVEARAASSPTDEELTVLGHAVRVLMNLQPEWFAVFQLRYRGLSVRAVAERLGLSDTTVSRWMCVILEREPLLAALLPRGDGCFNEDAGRASAGLPALVKKPASGKCGRVVRERKLGKRG